MKHLLIKSWMLSEEPLRPDQARALDAHLATCESCQTMASAWLEARALITSVPPAEPAEGLAERWHARFIAQNQELASRKQRQSWWFFFIAAGLAVLLFLMLLTQIITSFNSPVEIFLSGVQLLTGMVTFLGTLQGLVTTLAGTFITLVPPVGWFLLTGVLCALIIIWLVSLRLVIYPRRVSP